MSNFKQLKVWQAARTLAVRLYRSTARFPKSELYGLSSQIRSAATSICANIAEGCGRASDKEMRRFLFIARGSAHELESHLLIAREVDLITAEEWADLDSGVQKISAMLLRLAEAQD